MLVWCRNDEEERSSGLEGGSVEERQVGSRLRMKRAACGRGQAGHLTGKTRGKSAAKIPGKLTSIATLFGVAAAAASPSAVVVRHCGLAICGIQEKSRCQLPLRGSRYGEMAMDGGVAEAGWLFATGKANAGCETANAKQLQEVQAAPVKRELDVGPAATRWSGGAWKMRHSCS